MVNSLTVSDAAQPQLIDAIMTRLSRLFSCSPASNFASEQPNKAKTKTTNASFFS